METPLFQKYIHHYIYVHGGFSSYTNHVGFQTVSPIRVRSHDRYDGPSRRILIKSEAIFQKHLEMAGMVGENKQPPSTSKFLQIQPFFCWQQKCPGCCADQIHMACDLGDQHLITTKGVGHQP